jgi:hypothetical protein
MKLVPTGWTWKCLAIAALFLAGSSWGAQTKVDVVNELDIARKGETIELNWGDLKRKHEFSPEHLVVKDARTGQEVVSQVVDDELIFQTDFAPKETKQFVIEEGTPAKTESKVFGRFVPERLDDFAWESDKIAFRMYGPAIEKVEPPSGSGVDVWAKSTSRLVINDRYKGNDYHVDHGEGLDCYKVGPDRGCGGIAIWKDGKYYISRDFRQWKQFANGPIRVEFELTYDPWDAGGVKVSEVKRISLDAGSHFNRMQSVFKFDGADSVTVGVGLNEHPDFQVLSSPENGWMGVWDQADRPKGLTNGMNGVGVAFPTGVTIEFKEAQKQVWFLTPVKAGEPLVYYAGAGWSKGGFPEASDWKAYIAEFAKRVRSPLKVHINP